MKIEMHSWFPNILGAVVAFSLLFMPLQMAAAQTLPTAAITMSVESVVPGGFVTILFNNLPPNTDFVVRESLAGDAGINGYRVAGFSSGSGGTMEQRFEIASPLRDEAYIDIRIDGGSYGTSDWTTFANNSLALPSTFRVNAAVSGAADLTSARITMTVTNVNPDHRVTVHITGLPNNLHFLVTEGLAGSAGLNGYQIAGFDSGILGYVTATFEIAVPLQGAKQIDLRISCGDQYAAYITFTNV